MFWGAAAAAQSPEEVERANELFKQGRDLVLHGKYAEACPKFKEAQTLRPGVGTLLNLADCYERLGRTASALRTFQKAEAEATEKQDDRATFASERIDALQPRLVRLGVYLPAENLVEGLEIFVNGVRLDPAKLGTQTPRDPGAYTVSASAPGRQPWSEQVFITRDDQNVTVPRLSVQGLLKPAPNAPVNEHDTDPGLGTQKIAALSTFGVSVVAGVVGAVFTVGSISADNDADERCVLGPDRDQCDQAGLDANDDALSRGNVATVAFIVAGVTAATGAVMWLTAPDESAATSSEQAGLNRKRLGVGLGLHPQGGSVALMGHF